MSTGTLALLPTFHNLQCVDFNVYVAALKPECTFYTWEEKVYEQEFLFFDCFIFSQMKKDVI